MCGICGIIDLKEPAEPIASVIAMSRAAAHRGPDDSGWIAVRSNGDVLSGGAGAANTVEHHDTHRDIILGLGHRRLSIIDLSDAGHQPMSDETGRYWIVYNGEVYNYIEIRQELQARGCRFLSQTDTEVVLQAFIEYGPDCLSRFNGMWAFAIYDRQKKQLFCARDRFGIKPFYYACRQGRFAFASEIKQLLELPWISRKANDKLLADFFLWGLETHTDETFIEGIKNLPGSHYAMVTLNDVARGTIGTDKFWHPVASGLKSEREAIGQFRELFIDAVRLRLRSDVPVGVTLSGGLDSSSVVCAAAIQPDGSAGRNLQAFNVEYEGKGYSERHYADCAAGKAGTPLTVLNPEEEDIERDWQRFIWHMEQPVGSLSYFSNYRIYQLIRRHGVPVVLSGQGGDELLLGYERYRTYDLLFRLKSHKWRSALTEVRGGTHHGSMPLSLQMAYGAYFSLPFLRIWRRRTLVRPFLKKEFYEEFSHHTEHVRRSTSHDNRTDLQLNEFFRYQLPHLLHHEDRMSMASSLETRLPFLDYRLLEFSLSVPEELLFRQGWSKFILRQAMEGILPQEIQWRTDKMGYETPTGRIISRNRDQFRGLLERHRDDSVINAAEMVRYFDGKKFDERLLCSVLTYLSWKETFDIR